VLAGLLTVMLVAPPPLLAVVDARNVMLTVCALGGIATDEMPSKSRRRMTTLKNSLLCSDTLRAGKVTILFFCRKRVTT
ncbi:MAG: hypothetical protein M3371_03100, partial [Acidobacteriota bacterium]|nr:hypothetical protein [Acidobacteriota bacterium]